MVTRQRRRPSATSGRLNLLLAGNVLALLILGWLLGRPDHHQSAAGERVILDEVPDRAPRPSLDLSARRVDVTLQEALRDEVAKGVENARKKSRGKVNASNVRVSVHVRELSNGATLVDLDGSNPMRPASNQKLLTIIAAVAALGPAFEFETRFEGSSAPVGGKLNGDLIARAAGDPLYREELDGVLTPWLDDLAQQLRQHGVNEVTGDLVLDEGTFEAPAAGPGWPDPAEYWKEYCALSGGFSANGGCISATLRPGRVGKPAAVHVGPRSHGLRQMLDVTTVAPRSQLNVRVGVSQGRFPVSGELPADVPVYRSRFAHPDPVELFGHAVMGGLAARGVKFGGTLRRARAVPPGEILAVLRSPLTSYLDAVLLNSKNSVADQVFLALGAGAAGAGDRAHAGAAVSAALQDLGVPTAGLVAVDGSGLSRDNRASAEQLTGALVAAVAALGAGADPILDALPRSGATGGLQERMVGGAAEDRVRAKTGFINGTSALSGVVEVAGEDLAFSVLVEYPHHGGLNNSCWKPMQDRICELLAGR